MNLDTSQVRRRPIYPCASHDMHVYRTHHRCQNQAIFYVTELDKQFCKYHLGDVLHMLDLESYTLSRLGD
jgi:hypothetical protein